MRLARLSLAAAFLLPAVALAAQTVAAPTAFDAASIKPSSPQPMNTIRIGMQTHPGRLVISGMSLRDLIVQAYGLKPYQVEGPDWMAQERFDINAETTAPLDRDHMVALLRPYLEQQFKLASHRESKVMNMYALIVAPGGLKLKPAGADDAAKPDAPAPQLKSAGGGPAMSLSTKGPGFYMMISPKGMSVGGQATLDRLAGMLSQQLDRPVVDMTGLKETYDIKLDFAPTGEGRMMLNGAKMRRPDSPEGGAAATDAEAPAPSLFTALPQQAGLKLDPRKGPVEMLVIDHAEKQPVGN